MADAQIHPTGTVSTPADYVVRDSVEFRLKGVYAHFNGSGAASDYLPVVRIISDAGTVALEAVGDTTVAAGESADVSWFPGVKPGGAVALGESRVGWFWRTAGQTIPSGVATTFVYMQRSGQTDPFGPLGYDGANFKILTVNNLRVYVDFLVQWESGNYDRYIDIAQPVTFPPQDLFTWRERDTTTPEGDVQHVTAVLVGDPAAPADVAFTLFQSSGVDRLAQGFVLAYSWPEIAGQGGWPG